MSLFVLLTLSACSLKQEESSEEIEKPSDSMIDGENDSIENELDFISIEKIETYEGMEITDWIDEQTVVLAKENQELGKDRHFKLLGIVVWTM